MSSTPLALKNEKIFKFISPLGFLGSQNLYFSTAKLVLSPSKLTALFLATFVVAVLYFDILFKEAAQLSVCLFSLKSVNHQLHFTKDLLELMELLYVTEDHGVYQKVLKELECLENQKNQLGVLVENLQPSRFSRYLITLILKNKFGFHSQDLTYLA